MCFEEVRALILQAIGPVEYFKAENSTNQTVPWGR